MSERTVDLIRTDVQSAKNEAKKNIQLPVREVEDLLALVDSLQEQTHELQQGNKAAVESREVAVRKARETCVTSNMHFAKVVELVDQLAERDRTIAQLREPLEFYADTKTYLLGVSISMGSAFPQHEPIKYDKGERARKALSRD